MSNEKMYDSRKIMIGKIWKKEGNKVAPLENVYRVFYLENKNKKMVLTSIVTGESLMYFPYVLADIYSAETFVNSYELYDLGYAFPDSNLLYPLSEDDLLEYEKEYNAQPESEGPIRVRRNKETI